jgi:PmbA protein
VVGSLLDECRAVAAQARRLGAHEAAATLGTTRGIDVEWRDGRIERIQQRAERSLSLELFVDGRYGVSTTSDLRPTALERFLADAIALTRLLEPDPYRGLPDPSRYARDVGEELELFDPTRAELDTDARIALVHGFEERVRADAASLPLVSVQTYTSDSQGESARVHTNGFEAVRSGTRFAHGAQAVVHADGGRRPMGAAGSVRRHRGELESLDSLARKTAERARHQLTLSKLHTGVYTAVVENRVVGRLLGTFLAPLHGSALQQKSSLWDGRLGQRIASPVLTLHDDPRRKRGLASALWDGDGFPALRRPLLEEGVLRTYLIDQYYARKLGVEPTGGSLHNLAWSLGDRSLEQLIADVGEGVLIEGFIGGNSNSSSGALSLGCSGRCIRGGALAESFSEANLSGHFGTLFEHLIALGDDPDPNSSTSAPSCVFEGVQLSGI